jgi:3-hydroxyacyl-CoA dehydrogenase
MVVLSPAVTRRIRRLARAAVLGAGVMGAAIAAHLANVGVPTVLHDIVPKDLTDDERRRGLGLDAPAVRNRFARAGLDRPSKRNRLPSTHPPERISSR